MAAGWACDTLAPGFLGPRISELTGRQQEALLYLGEGCPALWASEQLEFRAREGRSPSPSSCLLWGPSLLVS